MTAIVKCPWCGSYALKTRRGFVASHLSPGGVKCIAIGVSFQQAKALAEAKRISAERKPK